MGLFFKPSFGMVATQLCAFDPSREYFAAVSPDGRLRIWNVSSRSLHHQFTQSAHLQVKYTCLRWAPLDHPDGPLLALGTHIGDVFCWNIRKGDQVFHWKAEEGQNHAILDLCFSKTGSLWSCGDSPSIVQRDLKSGSVIRKVNADKKSVSKIELNREENCLISAGRSFVKLWDLSSGEMITKFSGHPNTVNGLELTGNDQYLFSSAVSQRIVNMWSLRESDSYQMIQTFSCASNPTTIASYSEQSRKKRVKRKKSQLGEISEVEVPVNSLLLAVHGKKLSVWQFSKAMQQNKPLAANTLVTMPKKDQSAEGIEFLSAAFIDANQLVLARGNTTQPRFERVTFRKQSEMVRRVQLEGNCSDQGLVQGAEGKASATGPKADVNVINAHDTMVVPTPKLDGDGSKQISLEEKLEQIAARQRSLKVVDEETSGNKDTVNAPSADSVGVLLLQALQSGDSQLLDTCLTVDDVNVIHKTVERLPTEYVLPFLNTVVQKFQSRPYMAATLIPWIQSIVMIHTSFLMSINGLHSSTLSGLYQTIDARLNSFDKLLKLSGRLDLLLSQISYREVHYRENVDPVSSMSIDDIPTEEQSEGEEDSDMED